MTLRFTILGCGSSPGVPRPNGDWGACDPSNPKNARLRASLLVERTSGGATTRVVIDTGPDFRAQCVRNGISSLDGVVYTHAHADHIHGIDDVRTFVLVSRRRMPIWANDRTFARLNEAFGYCFQTPHGSGYPPICDRQRIASERFDIDGPGGVIGFMPIEQEHGADRSLGFRIGDVAYCSDVSAFPDGSRDALAGLDVLIIDALQYRTHPSHLSLGQAIDVIRELAPKRAILTHMHTPLDYDTLVRELPDHIEPGYDGLTFEADDVVP